MSLFGAGFEGDCHASMMITWEGRIRGQKAATCTLQAVSGCDLRPPCMQEEGVGQHAATVYMSERLLHVTLVRRSVHLQR